MQNADEVQAQVKEELNAIDDQYRLQTGAMDSILTEDFLNLLIELLSLSRQWKIFLKCQRVLQKNKQP